jgi:WD40 repeat protein
MSSEANREAADGRLSGASIAASGIGSRGSGTPPSLLRPRSLHLPTRSPSPAAHRAQTHGIGSIADEIAAAISNASEGKRSSAATPPLEGELLELHELTASFEAMGIGFALPSVDGAIWGDLMALDYEGGQWAAVLDEAKSARVATPPKPKPPASPPKVPSPEPPAPKKQEPAPALPPPEKEPAPAVKRPGPVRTTVEERTRPQPVSIQSPSGEPPRVTRFDSQKSTASARSETSQASSDRKGRSPASRSGSRNSAARSSINSSGSDSGGAARNRNTEFVASSRGRDLTKPSKAAEAVVRRLGSRADMTGRRGASVPATSSRSGLPPRSGGVSVLGSIVGPAVTRPPVQGRSSSNSGAPTRYQPPPSKQDLKRSRQQAAKARRLEKKKLLERQREERERLGMMAEEWAGMRAKWWGHTAGDGTWKTVRVFISSTFGDMMGERDALTRNVFPQLNSMTKSRRVRVVPIDLRWGLSKLDTSDQGLGALEHCLLEIEASRPFFLYLAGERYGWTPPGYRVSDDPRFAWCKTFEAGHSITDLEVRAGFLRKPFSPVHAWMYHRSTDFMEDLVNERERRVFQFDYEPGTLQADFRTRLWNEIEEHPYTKTRKYACVYGGLDEEGKPHVRGLEGFERDVLQDLYEAVCSEFPPPPPPPSALHVERAFHDHFVQQRAASFIGRQTFIYEMLSFANGDCSGSSLPLVVIGEPGSGKTSLVCKFTKQFIERSSPQTHVIVHIVSASPTSTEIRETLLRLCHELVDCVGIDWDEENDSADYQTVKEVFVETLSRAGKQAWSKGGRVLLVMDAINQLSPFGNALSMDWFPTFSPTGIKTVFSTVFVTPALRALQRRDPPPVQLQVPELRDDEKREIVVTQLREYRKKLLPHQLDLVIDKKDSAKPLYLLTLCEELRLQAQYGVDGSGVDDKIREFPPTVPPLMDEVLKRIERDIATWARTSGSALAGVRVARGNRSHAREVFFDEVDEVTRSLTDAPSSHPSSSASSSRSTAEQPEPPRSSRSGRRDSTTVSQLAPRSHRSKASLNQTPIAETEVSSESGSPGEDEELSSEGASTSSGEELNHEEEELTRLGRQLVRDALTLLHCSRHGLTEAELLELLAPPGRDRLPPAAWARLYRTLEIYLRPQGEDGEGIIGFFHQQIRHAVERRYLFTTRDATALVMERLAQYCEAKADPTGDGRWMGGTQRHFNDLVYYQINAKDLVGLRRTLGSVRFIERRAGFGGANTEHLLRDFFEAQDGIRVIKFGELKGRWLGAPLLSDGRKGSLPQGEAPSSKGSKSRSSRSRRRRKRHHKSRGDDASVGGSLPSTGSDGGLSFAMAGAGRGILDKTSESGESDSDTPSDKPTPTALTLVARDGFASPGGQVVSRASILAYFEAFRVFVSSHHALLARFPHLAIQFALSQPDETPPQQAAWALVEANTHALIDVMAVRETAARDRASFELGRLRRAQTMAQRVALHIRDDLRSWAAAGFHPLDVVNMAIKDAETCEKNAFGLEGWIEIGAVKVSGSGQRRASRSTDIEDPDDAAAIGASLSSATVSSCFLRLRGFQQDLERHVGDAPRSRKVPIVNRVRGRSAPVRAAAGLPGVTSVRPSSVQTMLAMGIHPCWPVSAATARAISLMPRSVSEIHEIIARLRWELARTADGLSVRNIPRRYCEFINKPRHNRIVADFAGFSSEVTCMTMAKMQDPDTTEGAATEARSSESFVIALGFRDGSVQIVDAATGETKAELRVGGHTKAVSTIGFSPDSQRIVSGGHDSRVVVWDVAGQSRLAEFARHEAVITAAVWLGGTAPSGHGRAGHRRAITEGATNSARRSAAADSAARRAVTRRRRLGRGARNVRVLLTASMDRSLRISEETTADGAGETKYEELWPLKLPNNPVLSLAYCAATETVAAGHLDGQVSLFDASAKTLGLVFLQSWSASRLNGIVRLAWSLDGLLLGMGGLDGKVRLYTSLEIGADSSDEDEDREARLRDMVPTDASSRRVAAAFGVDYEEEDDTAHEAVWRELPVRWQGTSAVSGLDFSADTKRIVVSTQDRKAVVLRTKGGLEEITLTGHSGEIAAVQFWPLSDDRLVTASKDKTVKCWDAGTTDLRRLRGAPVRRARQDRIVTDTLTLITASTSPSHRAIAGRLQIGGARGLLGQGEQALSAVGELGSGGMSTSTSAAAAAASVFTTRTHSRAPRGSHAAKVTAACVCPDGSLRAVTGDATGDIKAWDGSSGEELGVLIGHNAAVTCLHWSAVAPILVSGDSIGACFIWDGASLNHRLTVPVVGGVAVTSIVTFQVLTAIVEGKPLPRPTKQAARERRLRLRQERLQGHDSDGSASSSTSTGDDERDEQSKKAAARAALGLSGAAREILSLLGPAPGVTKTRDEERKQRREERQRRREERARLRQFRTMVVVGLADGRVVGFDAATGKPWDRLIHAFLSILDEDDDDDEVDPRARRVLRQPSSLPTGSRRNRSFAVSSLRVVDAAPSAVPSTARAAPINSGVWGDDTNPAPEALEESRMASTQVRSDLSGGWLHDHSTTDPAEEVRGITPIHRVRRLVVATCDGTITVLDLLHLTVLHRERVPTNTSLAQSGRFLQDIDIAPDASRVAIAPQVDEEPAGRALVPRLVVSPAASLYRITPARIRPLPAPLDPESVAANAAAGELDAAMAARNAAESEIDDGTASEPAPTSSGAAAGQAKSSEKPGIRAMTLAGGMARAQGGGKAPAIGAAASAKQDRTDVEDGPSELPSEGGETGESSDPDPWVSKVSFAQDGTLLAAGLFSRAVVVLDPARPSLGPIAEFLTVGSVTALAVGHGVSPWPDPTTSTSEGPPMLRPASSNVQGPPGPLRRARRGSAASLMASTGSITAAPAMGESGRFGGPDAGPGVRVDLSAVAIAATDAPEDNEETPEDIARTMALIDSQHSDLGSLSARQREAVEQASEERRLSDMELTGVGISEHRQLVGDGEGRLGVVVAGDATGQVFLFSVVDVVRSAEARRMKEAVSAQQEARRKAREERAEAEKRQRDAEEAERRRRLESIRHAPPAELIRFSSDQPACLVLPTRKANPSELKDRQLISECLSMVGIEVGLLDPVDVARVRLAVPAGGDIGGSWALVAAAERRMGSFLKRVSTLSSAAASKSEAFDLRQLTMAVDAVSTEELALVQALGLSSFLDQSGVSRVEAETATAASRGLADRRHKGTAASLIMGSRSHRLQTTKDTSIVPHRPTTADKAQGDGKQDPLLEAHTKMVEEMCGIVSEGLSMLDVAAVTMDFSIWGDTRLPMAPPTVWEVTALAKCFGIPTSDWGKAVRSCVNATESLLFDPSSASHVFAPSCLKAPPIEPPPALLPVASAYADLYFALDEDPVVSPVKKDSVRPMTSGKEPVKEAVVPKAPAEKQPSTDSAMNKWLARRRGKVVVAFGRVVREDSGKASSDPASQGAASEGVGPPGMVRSVTGSTPISKYDKLQVTVGRRALLRARFFTRPRALICVFGGAGGLHDLLVPDLRALIRRGVVTAAVVAGAMILDGGTQAGVMDMVGSALAFRGEAVIRTLGVAPDGAVDKPVVLSSTEDVASKESGGPPGAGAAASSRMDQTRLAQEEEASILAKLLGERRKKKEEEEERLKKQNAAPQVWKSTLEKYHSSFFLTPSTDWGSETSTMATAITVLRRRLPSVAIIANGGLISRQEALAIARARVPLVVITGSGRLADAVGVLVFQRAEAEGHVPSPVWHEGSMDASSVRAESQLGVTATPWKDTPEGRQAAEQDAELFELATYDDIHVIRLAEHPTVVQDLLLALLDRERRRMLAAMGQWARAGMRGSGHDAEVARRAMFASFPIPLVVSSIVGGIEPVIRPWESGQASSQAEETVEEGEEEAEETVEEGEEEADEEGSEGGDVDSVFVGEDDGEIYDEPLYTAEAESDGGDSV